MARGEQLARQWKIIQSLLGSQRGKTASELATALGCHVRTIYRDLDALETSGFPLYVDKQEGKSRWHILERARHQIPLPLSLTEAMALYFSRDMLKGLAGTVFHESLTSLIDKLSATLPSEVRDYVNQGRKHLHVGFRAQRKMENIQPVIQTLQQAIAESRTVRIDYFTMSRRSFGSRQVEPYHLWFFDATFYLIGFCRKRRQIRIFAVDRIKSIAIQQERFRLPEDFDPENWMTDSFGVFRGKTWRVVIEFAPQVAGYIAERIWHPSQQLTENKDGSLILTVQVAGLEEIKHWLLQWAGAARVIEPSALARAVCADAREILRRYQDQPGKA